VHVALRRDERDEGFEWQQRAACRGEHAVAFFPPPHFERKELRLARERLAKAICRTCPVSSECLEYALSSQEPHGVWGGLNEVERRLVVQRRIMTGEPGLEDSGPSGPIGSSGTSARESRSGDTPPGRGR
jgi:WhiB family transcriptional regulator, redox-sensing transcriptional regulator